MKEMTVKTNQGVWTLTALAEGIAALDTKPVLHGDTLYAETVCTDKRESKSRPGEGIVTLEHIGRNQHGDIVAKAVRKTLVRKRPTESGPDAEGSR